MSLWNTKEMWDGEKRSATILIQNSPRTGKYDKDGKDAKIVCNHEHRKGEEPQLDEVSAHFLSLFKEMEKVNKIKIPYTFFNFAFEVSEIGEGESKILSKKSNSVFNQLLCLISCCI